MKAEVMMFQSKLYFEAGELITSDDKWRILIPLRIHEILRYNLTQWADRRLNKKAIWFWIAILFSAACWYGICKLIWVAYYGM